jgi:hypothetical protein
LAELRKTSGFCHQKNKHSIRKATTTLTARSWKIPDKVPDLRLPGGTPVCVVRVVAVSLLKVASYFALAPVVYLHGFAEPVSAPILPVAEISRTIVF